MAQLPSGTLTLEERNGDTGKLKLGQGNDLSLSGHGGINISFIISRVSFTLGGTLIITGIHDIDR